MRRLFISIVLFALSWGVVAQGSESFFQASLTPDIAIQSKDTTIKGITLNIWGENPQGAFALGFVNGSVGDSSGFSAGLANYCETYTGVHWSFVNISSTSFVGWQDGVVNIAADFQGFQSAFVNVAKNASGLQMGAVNYTETLNGVQLGFANIVVDNPWFSEFPNKLATGFPFLNWSF